MDNIYTAWIHKMSKYKTKIDEKTVLSSAIVCFKTNPKINPFSDKHTYFKHHITEKLMLLELSFSL